MFHRARLAAAGLCAAAALLSPTRTAAQGDYRTWLFAEGSTNAAFGFEQEILIGNPNPSPAQVTFELFSQDGQPLGNVQRTVPALARYGEYVRAIAGDQLGVAIRVTSSLPIVAERTMYWGNGLYRTPQNPTRITDMRGGHNERGIDAGARTWYFAEGDARGFWTFFAVANPTDTPANVTVTYVDEAGQEVAEPRVIAPRGRATFFPSALLRAPGFAGRSSGFSTIVSADVDVIAERQMYWGGGSGYDAGHAAMGIKTLSPTWLFAEGSQGGATGFDTWLLLLNPSAQAVNVQLDFFGSEGQLLAQTTRTVGARARAQVHAAELAALNGQAFSVRVSAPVGIAAERAMYWRGYREGHATAGATAAARKWGFAEGKQGGFALYQNPNDGDKRRFNTFFPLFNPNAAPATVTLHFYFEHGEGSGGNTGKTVTIPMAPNSRRTFWAIEDPDLANQKFAAFISADQPIVAERVVYWGANFRSGHASLGTALPDDFPLAGAPGGRATPGTSLTVSPNRGLPAGGTIVWVSGSGFGHGETGTEVYFGGNRIANDQFEVENDTTLRVRTPPAATGAVDVTVVTRGQTITQPQAFAYVDPNLAGPPVAFGDLYGVVAAVAAARPFDLLNSCTEHGGTNTFMFEVVAELRRRFNTNRWGLNWKRGNRGDLSQDIVNYYAGPEGTPMRDSTNVRIYDIIGGHCGGRPSPFWVDQTGPTRAAGAVGRYSVDPMCRLPRYRTATLPNGTPLFPECQ
jgi:hypothetical protein